MLKSLGYTEYNKNKEMVSKKRGYWRNRTISMIYTPRRASNGRQAIWKKGWSGRVKEGN